MSDIDDLRYYPDACPFCSRRPGVVVNETELTELREIVGELAGGGCVDQLYDGPDDYRLECTYCGGDAPFQPEKPDMRDWYAHHKPGCLWVRAQRWKRSQALTELIRYSEELGL